VCSSDLFIVFYPRRTKHNKHGKTLKIGQQRHRPITSDIDLGPASSRALLS